jgi:hypothetical protein
MRTLILLAIFASGCVGHGHGRVLAGADAIIAAALIATEVVTEPKRPEPYCTNDDPGPTARTCPSVASAPPPPQ